MGRIKGITVLAVVLLLGLLAVGCGQKSESTTGGMNGQKTGSASGQIEIDTGKYFSSEQVEPKERRAEVTLSASIESFAGAEEIRLWIPHPKSDDYQTIADVKVNGNFAKSDVYEDDMGNKILYAEWQLPKVKPSLSFSFDVARKEIYRKNFPSKEGASIPADIKAEYLPATGMVVTSGEPKEIAVKVTENKNSAFSKAEAIYDYIVENYKRDDSVKGCGRGDVCELVETKQGKCADIHSVFVSLARSAGVPAREIFGIRIKPEKEGDITGAYHCVGEFYMPSYGWVPVDASDVLKKMLKENLPLDDPAIEQARFYFFGAQNENYIALSSGRDLTLNPPQKAGKLNYFMYPYCEVDGKALDYLAQQDFKYTVTYKEL